MERFKPLTDFYETIVEDSRIGAMHISLYMALMQLSNTNNWQNPVSFYRESIMESARISRRTYNKCMNELAEFGYIKYEPSPSHLGGNKVYFRSL